MSDQFQAAVIEAIDGDRVPSFDFAKIADRAARQVSDVRRAPRKRSWLLAVALVGFPCLAAAAAVFPSPALRNAIVARLAALDVKLMSTTFVTATPIDPSAAVKTAAFHLVMPRGLPAGARLSTFTADGTGGASYTATYDLPMHRTAWFTLAKAVPHTAYSRWVVFVRSDGDNVTKADKLPAHVWIAGDEVVPVVSAGMDAAGYDAIKNAMGAHDAPKAEAHSPRKRLRPRANLRA